MSPRGPSQNDLNQAPSSSSGRLAIGSTGSKLAGLGLSLFPCPVASTDGSERQVRTSACASVSVMGQTRLTALMRMSLPVEKEMAGCAYRLRGTISCGRLCNGWVTITAITPYQTPERLPRARAASRGPVLLRRQSWNGRPIRKGHLPYHGLHDYRQRGRT